MSGIDDWSDAERDLYAVGTRAFLDDLERQQQEWRESWVLDTTSTDALVRKHNAKMRQLEEDHKAWLARFINGDADGGAQPTHELVQQEPHDASGRGPATPAGVPAGQTPHPHAAELERARTLRDMPMAEYAKRRAEFGVRSPTDMSSLFRETR